MNPTDSRRRGQAAAAWAEHAPDLARWALDHIRVRDDAYGGHHTDGSRTTRHVPATYPRLIQHFRAEDASDVLGLHVSSREEMCRTTWLDIDAHDGDDADPDVNFKFALSVHDEARKLGFAVRLLDSNGKGGYHVLIVHRNLVPMTLSWKLGKFLVRDSAKFGFAKPPESFPKSPKLSGKLFGGWVRLPGRHHKRDHFSRVWSPRRKCWLDGAAAIQWLLKLKGQAVDPRLVIPTDFVPEDDSVGKRDAIVGASAFPSIATTDLPLNILLPRLRGVRGSGANYMARCPAHRDRHPSLSITELSDKSLLVHCHAGCLPDEVMDAVELKLSHLFPSAFALHHANVGAVPKAAAGFRTEGDENDGHSPNAELKAILRQARTDRKHQLKRLARALELPVEPLESMSVGFFRDCWVFPEYDDRRRLVGLVYRRIDGSKTCERGSRRGLTLPPKDLMPGGTVYVVEGATDAAAVLSVGAAAIGRPAARASAAVRLWLRRRLRRFADREIIVVGDRDPIREGKSPGRDGARELAAFLGAELDWPVAWALPRKPYKDVREQVVAGEWSRGLTVKEVG